jgi:hypothetical protein
MQTAESAYNRANALSARSLSCIRDRNNQSKDNELRCLICGSWHPLSWNPWNDNATYMTVIIEHFSYFINS